MKIKSVIDRIHFKFSKFKHYALITLPPYLFELKIELFIDAAGFSASVKIPCHNTELHMEILLKKT